MRLPLCACVLLLTAAASAQSFEPYDSLTAALPRTPGLLDYYYDADADRILLDVPADSATYIYVNSLAAGVGSNDIGLDRGQLGDTRLVRFQRAGNKVLLIEPNQGFRAGSDNPAERRSVEEAFAQSVLWGFPVVARGPRSSLVDLTPFLLRDAHGVAQTLADREQGDYKVDLTRSALYLERTRSFPRNTEFEAIVTLAGKPAGAEVRAVTPTPEAVTTRQHHSFVALPEPGYEERAFDPRSGYYPLAFADFATPIGEPLVRRLILRHRLEKADPAAARSPAVEPIVYYVDPGAPEPVKSALVEGASWWNDAFEAAGFVDAFRVEELPADADPLDVRYNTIQWVHRSTRGWSYGSTVADPRTGEIIKGHVSLGSQRVRQDYLIAQGLVNAFDDAGTADPRLEAFALARLRQLSAHEVGHTLGLAHNFAASTNDRASVMDYPHPYAVLSETRAVDLSDAYAVGIGAWDEQAIRYGYGEFPEGAEADSLAAILAENRARGLRYVTDKDARPTGAAHPEASLWDNGASAAAELERVIALRNHALATLGEDNLAPGRPLAELENVLAPVYLAHRYQVEAAAKSIGGVAYGYFANDGTEQRVEVVPADVQRGALAALARTLTPEFLRVPDRVLALLPPQPPGYERDRELFDTRTAVTFDPYAAAEASVDHTLTQLLDPARVERVIQQHAADEGALGPDAVAEALLTAGVGTDVRELQPYVALVRARGLEHALRLASTESAGVHTRAWAAKLAETLARAPLGDEAVAQWLVRRFEAWERNPGDLPPAPAVRVPDGSPIGG